jgi:hypothetical protein
MNSCTNTKDKLPQFLQIKKQVQADYPRIARGKRNQHLLGKVVEHIAESMRILKKVDVRDIPDPSGRRVKFPRVDDAIAALRPFAIKLTNVEEEAVNRPEASAEFAKARELLSRMPVPEEDVMFHCKLIACLLQLLVDVQIVVESQKASSLPEEDLEAHIDAATRKAGLDGSNDSELARIRRMDQPDLEDTRTFYADVKAVARRKTDVLDQIDKHRPGFRQDVSDTINGFFRSVATSSQDADLARRALANLETIPAEEEAILIKQWITASASTGSENGFFDVRDLVERVLQPSAGSAPSQPPACPGHNLRS